VTNLRDKPFALIGVNVVGHDSKALKRVVEKEKLPWRSLADQGQIAAKWNLSGTPTLYVLDSNGVIRHKWVGAPGAKAIDTALATLIKETEAAQEDPRSFHLGFTPDDLLDAPEVGNAVQGALSKHSDLVAFHLGRGVPWEEALNEQPFPPAVEAYLTKWSRLKGRLRADEAVYLALTPLRLQRNGIAPCWGGDEASARRWKSRNLDGPETILAYTRFCRRMIQRFKPDYFAYGIEANMLADANPIMFEQFRILAKQVFETLKAENPELPIFLTFQIDLYHKHRAEQRAVVSKLLPYSDFIAVSTYPYMEGYTPHTLPEGWFADVAALDPRKPFAIAETGFIAEESYRNWLSGKTVEGSEDAQAAYVRRLLRSASRQHARFVVWFFPQDVDEFWKEQRNPLVKWFVKIWRDSGLVDGSGRERKGLKEWDRWLQRPRIPVRPR
jgi:hypothetical protein